MNVSNLRLDKNALLIYRNEILKLKPAHDLLIKHKINNGIKHTIIGLEDLVIDDECVYNRYYKEKIYFNKIVSLCSTLKKIYE